MLARVGYALIFCAGLPALLVIWALRLDAKLPSLPHVQSVAGGGGLALVGALLVARAMWDLFHRGGGLPMNAFPPPRLVTTGAYRLVAHPIYFGFGAIVAGVALATGSAAGLWIVTPGTWLGMAALVIGFERIDLRQRFGATAPRAWLAYPPSGVTPPSPAARAGAAVSAFGPWLIGYGAGVVLTQSRNDMSTVLPFERGWPVLEWTAVFYLGAYVWTALAPLVARESAQLRMFVRTGWCGTALILWLFFTFPFMAEPRAVDGASWAGRFLQWDRSFDSAGCAFPSFHVLWAFAAADIWARRIGPRWAWAVAVLIAASCVTTGGHALLDVFGGVLAFVAARHCRRSWELARAATERVANSWRDWRIGRMRVINHGAYVGAAAAAGVWLVGLLLGPADTRAIITVALCSVAGAGLWGQWLEASSQLSRPFGYFGGVFGACLGYVVAQLVWGDGWRVAGAFALAAPLIQAIGRLRCLVQGCCHGRPVTVPWLGIRYTQPLSRVCKLAGLGGQPIHPTPLYSILGNIVILGLLARLWREGADLASISGAYLILSTCARFMEEGYRGEPQTVRFGALPIYQWLAVGCLLAGIVVTTLPSPAAPAWTGFRSGPLVYALPIGALVWLAMGVDFPESSRRMSRLA